MRRIIGITVGIIAILIHLFFRHYKGHSLPSPLLMQVLALILFIAGLWIALTGRRKRANTDIGNQIREVKISGKAIKVDLDKVVIKTNNYTEEEYLYDFSNTGEYLLDPLAGMKSNIQMLNALGGTPEKNVKLTEVKQSVVLYTHEGKTYRSPVIAKDKETLYFLFANQNETYIYVDPQTGRYYFDLEFLVTE